MLKSRLVIFATIALVVFAMGVFAMPSLTLAGAATAAAGCPSGPGCEPPRLDDVFLQVYRIIDLAYAFGGIFFLGLGIFIGIQWMASQGNPDKLQELRTRLGYLVIGFVLFFLSATIVTFIYRALDVKDCAGNPMNPGFNLFAETACS